MTAMAYSEKTLTWVLIRKSLSFIKKAGINPIEFLIWSQVRELWVYSYISSMGIQALVRKVMISIFIVNFYRTRISIP